MNGYAVPTRKISTVSHGSMSAIFTEAEPCCDIEPDRFYDRQLAADLHAAERALARWNADPGQSILSIIAETM